MTVSAKYDFTMLVTETLTMGSTIKDQSIRHEIAGLLGVLDADSTVPATKVYSETVALSGGAKTLDLTALVYASGELGSVTFLGLKVQLFLFKNNGAASMTIVDGASNGYDIFGDSSGSVTIPAGGIIMHYVPNLLDDVAAADLAIDITGSGTETFDVHIVAG